MSNLVRRAISVPLLFVLTALLFATLPIWLPLTLVISLFLPRARGLPRMVGFVTAYAWCECLGVLRALWIWLRHGWRRHGAGREAWLAANYALQNWWCCALRTWAVRLFRLRFEIEGADALEGEAPLMLLRHCSIGDTMIPVVFYASAFGKRLRFVLKRELLLDPCLDIVGNRLPNYFADRSSTNTAKEVEGIKALARDLPASTGVLIYPEGTRFSAAKRAALLTRLEEKGDTETLARARGWQNVLPPKPAGALALFESNPRRDLVLCAHTGFEGSADFARLLNGSWLDTRVRMRFWRVPYAEIPQSPEDQRTFLYDLWDRMSLEVADLSET